MNPGTRNVRARALARTWWVYLLAGLWLGPMGFRAQATRQFPLTPEQLAIEAGLVVRARVEALETLTDRQGRIFTRVDLRVLEVWKGNCEESICRVVMGGGVLGDRSVSVVGQAAYRVGEEVVSFLVRNPAGEWVTVGLSQGRFWVRREPGSEEAWVSNGHWGESVPTRSRASLQFPMHRPLTVKELKRRTQEARP